jgi:phenylpropionate dioxygenase-like ring-hydroxylating dioxygenase large terminal subunit
MLSAAENQLITRTGPGTPMGELFRRYWLPAMLSSELPEPDCTPARLRLLGEDLVAFRTTSGQVGVLDTYCPHRNANLFWGRNEEDGLRCVYHGWKFDTSGNCVDMPSEPPASRYSDKVKTPAYPAVERGGVVWVYMGSRERTPSVPDLEWTRVPDSHRLATKRIQHCNYLQNLEGEVDSAHVSFLHSSMLPRAFDSGVSFTDYDRHPVFDVKETGYGLAISARRDAPDDQYYWRVTQFLLPTYTMIPATPGGSISFTATVPIDDTNMVGLTVTWHPDRPLDEEEVSRIRSWTGVHTEVDSRFEPLRNLGNEYLIDRAAQKSGASYTGIRGIREQDLAVQEDQRGPVSDRVREHLGTSDRAVIATRRRLLHQLAELARGVEPAEPFHPEAYAVRSAAFTDARSLGWEFAGARFFVADAGREGLLATP